MKPDLSKIVGSFNSLNDQMRYAILGGVVFLILLLDGLLLVWPQISSISDNNDQIKQISDDTQQVLVDKRGAKGVNKSLQEERNQLSSLNIKVRPMQEVPAILSTISSIAKEYDVKIDQLIPEYSLLETLNTVEDSKYYALPVLIKARSGYHHFGHFLNKVENGDLFFVMKEFIIQNDEKNPNVHSYSLTIKIILKE